MLFIYVIVSTVYSSIHLNESFKIFMKIKWMKTFSDVSNLTELLSHCKKKFTKNLCFFTINFIYTSFIGFLDYKIALLIALRKKIKLGDVY